MWSFTMIWKEKSSFENLRSLSLWGESTFSWSHNPCINLIISTHAEINLSNDSTAVYDGKYVR